MNETFRFILFFAVVIIVYGSLNYYFVKKHSRVVTLGTIPAVFFRLVLTTIILAPIATIVFSMHGPSFMATVSSFTGYSWLAFLFLFLMIHGMADILFLAARCIGFQPAVILERTAFLLTTGVSIFILLYGWHEAGQIQIERVQLETRKLPADIMKIRLVIISDVHFSPIIGEEAAEKISKLIQKENPDIIICTGDLLDRGINHPEKITKILSNLPAKLGKYAVTGNHEFIAGIKESEKFIQQAGFQLLRNRIVSVDGILNIVGVDDPTAQRFGDMVSKTEDQLFSNFIPHRYTILAKHQPHVNKNSTGKFDLQISGHTHAGQIFPFTLLVKLVFPHLCGMYELDNNSKLYVNRGTGTWGPPFRFLAPPEITVFELKKSSI